MANYSMRFLLATIALAIVTGVVRAQDATTAVNSISVVGVGTVKGKPKVVEISAVVMGEGELAADASVKFRDTRKKATEALDGMKNASLSIESKGFSINQAMDQAAQMRMMQGMGSDGGKQKVAVTEQLRLVLKDVDQLELDKLMETVLKVIDVGRDNGLQIGPGNTNYYQMQMMMQTGQGMNMISFKIPDPTALREEAYKLAVADARAKAEKLASLSGVKLGRILAVQDQDVVAKNDVNTYYQMIYGYRMGQQEQVDRLSSNVFGEIPLSVRLSVQFEIAK